MYFIESLLNRISVLLKVVKNVAAVITITFLMNSYWKELVKLFCCIRLHRIVTIKWQI